MASQLAANAEADSFSNFSVEIKDRIAHIQLSRPEAFNTMDPAFWQELPAIVRDIDEGAKARVIVISSTGKHFCAGMDLAVFQNPTSGVGVESKIDPHVKGEALRIHCKHLQDTFTCLDEARVPVLMAIQGGCIGGGVDFASAVDMRYATRDAFFCVQEINIGMTADVGTFPRLCHLLPQGLVRELAYTGRRFFAEEALEHGLVNALFDSQEEMMEHVFHLAREIATKNPVAITGSKVMINYARDHSIRDGLDYIATWQAGMFPPKHMAEAFTAQAEKRLADFPELRPLKKGVGN